MCRKLLGFTVCGKLEERHLIHDGVPIHANIVATYRRGAPEPPESNCGSRAAPKQPQPGPAAVASIFGVVAERLVMEAAANCGHQTGSPEPARSIITQRG
jgi:hypothetical protein